MLVFPGIKELGTVYNAHIWQAGISASLIYLLIMLMLLISVIGCINPRGVKLPRWANQ